MGRRDKLRDRFLSRPADFTWRELERFLAGFGYRQRSGQGSRRVFEGAGLPRIRLHKPHPGTIVRQYALEQVRELLEREGLL